MTHTSIHTVEDVVREFESNFVYRGRDEFGHKLETLAEHRTIDEAKEYIRTSITELLKQVQSEIGKGRNLSCDCKFCKENKETFNAAKEEDMAIIESIMERGV